MYLGNVLLKTNLFELTSRTQACRSAKIIYLNVMSSLTWSISKISLWVYPSLKYHCKRLSRSSIIQIDKKIKFSAQHVLLNILQQTWKRLIQQTIKSYTIYNIWNKIHQHLEKNTQNLKIGNHCTKQLKLFPKTKKFLYEIFLIKSKKNYFKLKKNRKLHKTWNFWHQIQKLKIKTILHQTQKTVHQIFRILHQ